MRLNIAFAVIAGTVLLCGTALADPAAPKLTWSQNDNELFMTFHVACEGEGPFAAITTDQLAFKCTSKSTEYAMEFTLREDVVASTLACVVEDKTTKCSVSKLFPHFFDRLHVETKKWKKHISREWNKGFVENDETGEVYDYVEEFKDASNIVIVKSNEKLQALMAKHAFLVMFVWYPWCQRCRFAQKQFVETAKLAKSSSDAIAFAYVDAREISLARRLFNPECSFDCKVYVSRLNEAPLTFDYTAGPADQLAELRKHMKIAIGDVAHDLDSMNAFARNAPVAVILETSSKQSPAFAAFRSVAMQSASPSTLFGVAVADDVSAPVVTLYRDMADRHNAKKITFTGDASSAEQIGFFVNTSALELVTDLTDENRATLESYGLPILIGFVEKKRDKQVYQSLFDIAKELRGKIIVTAAVPDESQTLMRTIGFRRDHTAASVGIVRGFGKIAHRYMYESRRLSSEAIVAWAKKVLAGEQEPTFKSNDAPENENEPGHSLRIVGKTLPWYVKQADRVMLLVLFDQDIPFWLGRRGNTFMSLSSILEDTPQVRVGEMDSNNNDWNHDVFPGTEDYVNKVFFFAVFNNTVTRYQGAETLDSLVRFIKTVTPDSLQVNWNHVDRRVATEVKKLRSGESDVRAEFRKFLDKTSESAIEVVSLGPHDEVVKYVRKAGRGPRPANGAQVDLTYSAHRRDGSEFDQEFDIITKHVGDPNQPECLNIGFKSMRPGERAVLYCSSAYAYHGDGFEKRLAPHEDIYFEIDFVRFRGPRRPEEAPDSEL